jgi:hypothetical protein
MIKTTAMTITLITSKDRAIHIFESGAGYYQAELFEPTDKMYDDQTGVRLTFKEWMDAEAIALIMFHTGVSYGLESGIKTFNPSYKPNRYKVNDIMGLAHD